MCIRDRPSGNDVESGTPVAIKANKAVVLTTGGFGRDLAFRQEMCIRDSS